MSHDDEPPPTNFVALTPRAQQVRRLTDAPGPAPIQPSAPPVAPVVHQGPPTPSTGAGGFSGYQVNTSTTATRVEQGSSRMWVALGLGLGLVLLGAGAVALTFLAP